MRPLPRLPRTLTGTAAFMATVLSLAAALTAGATVVIVPTLEEMSVASDVIVEADVGDAKVLKDNGRIVTLTNLVVRDGLKGKKAGDTVVIYQLGGAIDGKNAWIAGAHRFEKGERVVLFGVNSLQQKKYGPNVVVPYGIGVGLFRVVEELTGARVEEIIGDVVAFKNNADGSQTMETPRARTYDSLASFKATVKSAIAMKDAPEAPHRERLAPKMRGQ